MRLSALAQLQVTPEWRACAEALDPAAPADYRELAALLAMTWRRRAPQAVGLAGGQGAGKSTLARLLVEAAGFFDLRCAALSLDDFYLGADERRALARRVHPLFVTRGPPGTHDVAACRQALIALGQPGTVRVPVFDKGRDDRAGERALQGPFDVVLLEGWCVGARPAADTALAEPCNALEAQEDAEARWRGHSNRQLAGAYAELFAELECLLFLRVPSLDAVRRWRLQQESERPPQQRRDAAAVARFVAHFERITRAMLADLPGRADAVIELDEAHRVSGLRWRVPDAAATPGGAGDPP